MIQEVPLEWFICQQEVCMSSDTLQCSLYLCVYRIAGKVGGEFNLADWRICERTAEFSMISFCGWGLEHHDYVTSVRVRV